MLIIDSVVSVVIWLILIYIIQNIILYVLYGKKEVNQEDKENIKDKNKFMNSN
jgi:hypothetical protein